MVEFTIILSPKTSFIRLLFLNPKYVLAILRHGAQGIAASDCFKISHLVAVFDPAFAGRQVHHPCARDASVSKQPDFTALTARITKPYAYD